MAWSLSNMHFRRFQAQVPVCTRQELGTEKQGSATQSLRRLYLFRLTSFFHRGRSWVIFSEQMHSDSSPPARSKLERSLPCLSMIWTAHSSNQVKARWNCPVNDSIPNRLKLAGTGLCERVLNQWLSLFHPGYSSLKLLYKNVCWKVALLLQPG